eukprot:Gregarina_sp_Pseudo_9__5710@NODE_822_length_2165_cov_7_203198_g771_i0_p1_GENE_NODE_822_length_2165_cov_7_203198_g771_i0NODE_822_length_2165_cov_7_203198_g771_i0_p1_ORF_typecomplete_len462_score3_16DBR1/PF05011_13/0_028_NODE_822_length_2165_cov_7_203198_g771_i05431928
MESPKNAVIALQGCIHGEMNKSFDSVQEIGDEEKWHVSLLLWSGDVQTIRNGADLDALACPPKFRALKDFHHYYNGDRQAPCLTLFIGGNHESSNFLHPLWFGGWVAPNMYYMGRSGVVNIDNSRLAGLSGIFKGHDYDKGYFEEPPFDAQTMRSVYHVRHVEVNRLHQLRGPLTLMLTHDWPTEVIQTQADQQNLLRRKPYFAEDLRNGRLGNPHLMGLLRQLKPPLWVSAHLHVNFQCHHRHENNASTHFIAHDKPKRSVSTSLLEMQSNTVHFCYRPEFCQQQKPKKRKYESSFDARLMIDLEWLLILKSSWPEVSTERTYVPSNYKLCWRDAKEIALNIEAQGLAQWWERLNNEQGDQDDAMEIPRSVELWKYSFPIPSWTVLDFRNPWKQTQWWFNILGISESDRHGPFKEPSEIRGNPLLLPDDPANSAPNPLLDSADQVPLTNAESEEEAIDLF